MKKRKKKKKKKRRRKKMKKRKKKKRKRKRKKKEKKIREKIKERRKKRAVENGRVRVRRSLPPQLPASLLSQRHQQLSPQPSQLQPLPLMSHRLGKTAQTWESKPKR